MKKEEAFLTVAKQNPAVFQYIPFKAHTPYISAFDANGKREARQVTNQDIKNAADLSIKLDTPVLSYENGVYCWAWGADCVFLFVEPDFAAAFEATGTKVRTDQFVPMVNGETLLTFPSLVHLRNASYLHQKAKLTKQNLQTQKQK